MTVPLCYIPTADAYDKKTGGGYEVVSAKFVAPTGHEMTDILINLVNQFTPSAVPPPQTVPAVNKIWDANAR